MKVKERHISGKAIWFVLLLALQQMVGLIPGASAGGQLIAANKETNLHTSCYSDLYAGIPAHLQPDEGEGDAHDVFRATRKPRKTRYYISSLGQRFSASQRICHDAANTSHRLILQENKTGVYQQQDAFLPTYYSFLFRYTLF